MLDPVEPEFGQKARFFSLIRSLAAIAKIAQAALPRALPWLVSRFRPKLVVS
jgi:hypothetical protein